jgi:two-component system cell cycle sensor histidine kinase/response regulator CckA
MQAQGDLRARLNAISGLAPLLQDFFLASPVAFQIYDLSGRSLAVNQAFLDLFGSEPPPGYCVFEDTLAIEAGYVPAFRRAFAGEGPIRLPVVWYSPKWLKNVSVDGNVIAIETMVFPIFGKEKKVEFAAFAFKDATREETSLKAQRDTQFLLERAQEVAATGSWIWDMSPGGKVVWSKNEYKILGIAPGERQGSPEDFLALVHPDDRPLVEAGISEVLKGRAAVKTEFRIIRPDGQIRYICETAEIIPGDAANPPRMIGVTKDVTDERRAAEQIRASEARYRSLFDSAIFGYFVARNDGSIVEANPAFLSITGYSREDLVAGRVSWRSLTPPEYAELDERAIMQLRSAGFCSVYEKEYLRQDGTRIPVLVGGSWANEEKTEILAFAHDLRDQKRLEQQFHQAQRLESIGRLAGGVAHDFNNILGIILLYLDDLRTDVLDASGRRERVESITKHVQRAIRLTKQLLTFGRRQTRAPRTVQLNAIIEEMREMLGRLLPETIRLEYALGQGLPFVKVDTSQLEQVLLNLVANARDAIDVQGEIRILTDRTRLSLDDLARLRLAVAHPGEFVRLSVIDNGTGIDPRLLPHIYEPFFTTKEIGKGTGLGLATVYGVVRQSGGDVRVSSELGRGTTFDLYFPVDAGPAPELSSAGKPKPARPASTGLVLLVEDQPELRELMREILVENGYRVLEAGSGPAALDGARNWTEEPRLVVADVIMPEMTGPAFLRALEQVKNRAYPVMYVSGYPQAELSRYGLEASGVMFLEKPFTKAAFLDRVQSFFV